MYSCMVLSLCTFQLLIHPPTNSKPMSQRRRLMAEHLTITIKSFSHHVLAPHLLAIVWSDSVGRETGNFKWLYYGFVLNKIPISFPLVLLLVPPSGAVIMTSASASGHTPSREAVPLAHHQSTWCAGRHFLLAGAQRFGMFAVPFHLRVSRV